MAKKTWQQKLHDGRKPEVEITNKKFADIPAGARMLIPTPILVDAYLRQIPKGSQVDMLTMRKDLAIEHKADYTCPLTSGIFVRIVAEAAYEQFQLGAAVKNITPFWRIINKKSTAYKKLTFGGSFVDEMRAKEGLQ